MTHTNEILELLDNMIACGESVARVGRILKKFLPEMAEAIPQKPTVIEVEATTDTAPAELPETEEPAKTYTFADVRKVSAAKSHAGHTAEVRALITKYGADRLSDVKEADYPALMADLEVL